MYRFTEAELERACIEWFEELGYEYRFGPDISPEGDYPERKSYSDVILDDRLKSALQRINRHVPSEALGEALRKIKVPQSPSLLINNKEFQRMITDGMDVNYRLKDGTIKYDKVWLFDFECAENNDWLVVNQFTVVENRKEKRPDVVIFVNGLPLVVIELKSSSDESVGLSEGYNQLQTYKAAIPYLFTYNSFMVISDGINARAGTLTSKEERFMMWRTIDGQDIAPTSIPQLEVLIKGCLKSKGSLI